MEDESCIWVSPVDRARLEGLVAGRNTLCRVRQRARWRTTGLFAGYFFVRVDGAWWPITRQIGVWA